MIRQRRFYVLGKSLMNHEEKNTIPTHTLFRRCIRPFLRVQPAGTSHGNTNCDLHTCTNIDRRSHHMHERFAVCTCPVLPPDELYQFSLQAAMHPALYGRMHGPYRLRCRALWLCGWEMPGYSRAGSAPVEQSRPIITLENHE